MCWREHPEFASPSFFQLQRLLSTLSFHIANIWPCHTGRVSTITILNLDLLLSVPLILLASKLFNPVIIYYSLCHPTPGQPGLQMGSRNHVNTLESMEEITDRSALAFPVEG
jgi:hypothetical protein